MNLIFRFIWTLLFSRFESKVDLLQESTTTFRVLPTDIDVLMHMNNGVYFSLMDLARINFMIRNQTFPRLKQNLVYPVVASEMMRFRKSIQLFQRFEITTRIMGWDNKFFYVAHHFKCKNKVLALSIVKARFLRKSAGSIDPQEVIKLIGVDIQSPPLPDWVKSWQHADKEFHDESLGNPNS